MRVFSSAVQTAIDSNNLKFFYLIKLEFSSTYHFCSYHRDITYDGDIYLADGGLYEFDPPKFSSVVDRESYRIVIADLLDNMSAEFRLNVVGKAIEVKVVLLDVNDQPLLDTGDVLSIYKGFVDSPTIESDMETKVAVIEGTSPMADLDMVRSFITSKSGMDQKSSSDTSFDEIFANKEISVKWGKI